ncbi:MAG: hypothetical protein OXT06_27895 [Rhodospirillaceae bacterium]|nr:hypothetical protein [Rhodospirillaceae bacterium]
MKQSLKFSALALTLIATASLPSTASAAGMSQTVEASLAGPSIILSGIGVAVHGSAYTLVNGGKLVVESAKLVGDKTVVLVKHASTGAKTVLETSGNAFGRFSKLTGRTVEAVATSAGTIIADSAKVVLFIPTQAGRALFEASEYQEQ